MVELLPTARRRRGHSPAHRGQGVSGSTGGVPAWGMSGRSTDKIWQILTVRKRKEFDSFAETGP